MKKLTDVVFIADVTSCPESVWIVDVGIVHSAGHPWHCALVQDLKTKRVLGWATAQDEDPTLMRRAVKRACTRAVRTRPSTLYLDSGYANATPKVIATLSCQEFQLRFIGRAEQFLLKPLEAVWGDLQARFTEAGGTSINDDWFD
jgi:hypothetical protein